MRHVRMLGLCAATALAVVALAGLAASSAFAKVEEGQCYAKEGGSYANSNCTAKAKKGSGAYEWRKASELGNKNVDTEGGAGVLSSSAEVCSSGANEKECTGGSTIDTVSVECQREHGGGTLTPSGTGLEKTVVYFYECKALGAISCSNSEAEEIITDPLTATFGYINKASKEAGVDLNPQVKHGEFAKFTCGGVIETVVGAASSKEFPHYPGKGGGDGIVSSIAPTDQMGAELTQDYTINPETNENIPSKLEGKPVQLLEDYIEGTQGTRSKWAAGGETIVNMDKLASGEEAELKA
jgi:hypothetical protein